MVGIVGLGLTIIKIRHDAAQKRADFLASYVSNLYSEEILRDAFYDLVDSFRDDLFTERVVPSVQKVEAVLAKENLAKSSPRGATSLLPPRVLPRVTGRTPTRLTSRLP
jgi:hypothetical protein